MIGMIKKLDLAPCQLGEGPLWHRETGEYVFTDILTGELFACKPDGQVRSLLKCNYLTGAFLFDETGDLLILTEKGVFRCPYGGTEADFKLIYQIPMANDERFNDAICDPKGRILAGTKTDRNVDGKLWVLEAGKQPRVLLDNLKITNGMGFAEEGKIFYHTDSGNHTIFRYSYDVETGSISEQSVFVTLTDDNGAVPDGMTVDAKGNVWTALWGGNCVRQYAPDGQLMKEVAFPANQTSSIIFGGEKLDSALVTSAAVGREAGEDGGIWLIDPACSGVEEFRAII